MGVVHSPMYGLSCEALEGVITKVFETVGRGDGVALSRFTPRVCGKTTWTLVSRLPPSGYLLILLLLAAPRHHHCWGLLQ